MPYDQPRPFSIDSMQPRWDQQQQGQQGPNPLQQAAMQSQIPFTDPMQSQEMRDQIRREAIRRRMLEMLRMRQGNTGGSPFSE